MKYESFIINGLNVMANIKDFFHAANTDATATTLDPRTFVPAP